MHHIIILTPSLARVSVAWSDTYAQIVLECSRRGIKLSRADATDPGLLPHARNVLLASAVESDATHAFWWDADVSFESRALFDLLDRPQSMICRPYPMRGTDWESVREMLMDRDRDCRQSFAARGSSDTAVPTVDELRTASLLWSVSIDYQDGKPVWSNDRELVRVRHTGFGFVLHKMEPLRRFAQCSGLRTGRDWHDRAFVTGFDHGPNDQAIEQGEDVSFCARWRKYWAGYDQIWAAPDLVIRNGGRAGMFLHYLALHRISRPITSSVATGRNVDADEPAQPLARTPYRG